ncbi:diaminopimelate epimerase [Arcanobacterium bovis]|uniref:diaminopimelate epimerase n=1 Tax=Arcanobacterium bovis TaxID=2529275 RepID=UPI0019D5670A|nr:diaminopimelate epimerase [Arcanobacterium bovis]
MAIDFIKLHGLGNDFVVIDGMKSSFDPSADQVRELCDRHFGVGADGVIVVQPPKNTGSAGYMHYINADGSLAQMCGNGVRCTAKFLVDEGYVDATCGNLTVDTLAGPRSLSFTAESGKLTTATVNMGQPIFEPAQIPVRAPRESLAKNPETGVEFVRNLQVQTPWGDVTFTCISMGNPHAIWFIDSFDDLPDTLFDSGNHESGKNLTTMDIDKIGAFLEAHPIFPEKSNIEFVSVHDGALHTRVFERGVGETLACGTGACATGVAGYLTGRTGRRVDVVLPGGTLEIEWTESGAVNMTGPAAESFRGTI